MLEVKQKALNQVNSMQLCNTSPQPAMPHDWNQDSCPDHGGGLKKLGVISLKVPACLIVSHSERCEVSYGSQEELTPQLAILLGQWCCPA